MTTCPTMGIVKQVITLVFRMYRVLMQSIWITRFDISLPGVAVPTNSTHVPCSDHPRYASPFVQTTSPLFLCKFDGAQVTGIS